MHWSSYCEARIVRILARRQTRAPRNPRDRDEYPSGDGNPLRGANRVWPGSARLTPYPDPPYHLKRLHKSLHTGRQTGHFE